MANENDALWREAAGRVLQMLRAGDGAGAIRYLDKLGAETADSRQSVGATPAFRQVIKLLYWEQKALPEAVTLSQEVIRRLETALDTQPGRTAGELIRPLGGTYYNLASFAWPGWDEPGITIGPREFEAGRHAAKRSLELCDNPAHSAINFGCSLSAAYWIVGAYCMAKRDWSGARARFRDAERLSEEGSLDRSLAQGYLRLTDLLEKPGDAAARDRYDAMLVQLGARHSAEEARFVREQLATARSVFSRKFPVAVNYRGGA